MNRRYLLAVCGALLAAAPMFAQDRATGSDPISGNWGSDGVTFLELKLERNNAVSGTAIWRDGSRYENRAAIETGTFDSKTGALKLEGEAKGPDGVVARYVIDGKLDKDTLAGTFKFGSRDGQFTFVRQASQRH